MDSSRDLARASRRNDFMDIGTYLCIYEFFKCVCVCVSVCVWYILCRVVACLGLAGMRSWAWVLMIIYEICACVFVICVHTLKRLHIHMHTYIHTRTQAHGETVTRIQS
jgi:hypothetical protein